MRVQEHESPACFGKHPALFSASMWKRLRSVA